MRTLRNLVLSVIAMGFVAQEAQAQLARRKSSYQDPNMPSESGTAFDNTIQKKDVKARRVAIIPNRLPLFLTEADHWRKFNWQVLAGMFEDRGFDVADYDSTAEAFTRSNLPMEDTGASEEKFARMAEILQADLLIMPFYGTSFSTQMIIVAQVPSWIGLVTLQIYDVSNNKFIYRSDQTGKVSTFIGWAMVGMVVGMLLPDVEEELPDTSYWDGFQWQTIDGGTVTKPNPLSMAMPLVGLAMDLVQSFIPARRRWEMAFIKADRKALAGFFASFPGPMGAAKKKKTVKKAAAKPAPVEESAEEEEVPPAKTAPARKTPAKAAPVKEEASDEEDLGLGVDE